MSDRRYNYWVCAHCDRENDARDAQCWICAKRLPVQVADLQATLTLLREESTTRHEAMQRDLAALREELKVTAGAVKPVCDLVARLLAAMSHAEKKGAGMNGTTDDA